MNDQELDGTDEQYPNRQAAVKAYREMYLRHRYSRDMTERLVLERSMDAKQPEICRGPGPVWQKFFATLPKGRLTLRERIKVWWRK